MDKLRGLRDIIRSKALTSSKPSVLLSSLLSFVLCPLSLFHRNHNIFLQGDLNDDAFMEQPLGFVDSLYFTHVCKLDKSL